MKAELKVFSNAKNYRRDPIVPLVVPTVNPEHFEVLNHQRTHFGLEKGFLVCNSNCAVIGVVIPFKALEKFGPIDAVSVVTMQAVSGAGYPGVSSMDIITWTLPHTRRRHRHTPEPDIATLQQQTWPGSSSRHCHTPAANMATHKQETWPHSRSRHGHTPAADTATLQQET